VVNEAGKTFDLTSGHEIWTATVEGDRVSLQGLEGVFVVRERRDDRWSVERSDHGEPLESGRTIGTDVALAMRCTVSAVRSGDVVWIGIDGYAIEFRLHGHSAGPRSADRDQDALSPPMPATVVRVQVRPGDRVELGDTLVVLEAMKMELPIRAPREATVRAVHCAEGQRVQPGEQLIELDD